MAADRSSMHAPTGRQAQRPRAVLAWVQGCVIAFAGLAINPAQAQAPTADASTHSWHDGQRQRRLTLQPDLQADFTPQLGKGGPIQPGPSGAAGLSALGSPVLRDDTGQLRALPGGVLVILKSPLDSRAAQTLFKQAGVTASRQLTETLWLVESPAGLASLEMANRLHASGLFASAQPNWWMKRTLK